MMPWFRANMTAMLYEYAKKHMSNRSRVYSAYQLDIGAGTFKRAFVTHRNAASKQRRECLEQVSVLGEKEKKC